MELYLFGPKTPNYHDCSVRNRTFEQWAALGDVDYVAAGFALVYGCIVTIIYILFMFVFATHRDISSNSFYRIMFWISLCDLSTTFMVSDVQGVLLLMGAVYCMYPNYIYYIGCIGEAGWAGSCIGCFFLIVSRLVDVVNKEWYNKLFSGKGIFVCLSICFMYWCIFYFFVNPVLFNSTMKTWLYDPLIYENGQFGDRYTSRWVLLNNLVLTSVNMIIYFVFVCLFINKYSFSKNSQNKTRIMFFVQSTVVCFIHVLVGFFYVFMNWIPLCKTLSCIAAITYHISGGGAAISYVLFNRTIRSRMLVFLRRKQKNSSVVIINVRHNSSMAPCTVRQE